MAGAAPNAEQGGGKKNLRRRTRQNVQRGSKGAEARCMGQKKNDSLWMCLMLSQKKDFLKNKKQNKNLYP